MSGPGGRWGRVLSGGEEGKPGPAQPFAGGRELCPGVECVAALLRGWGKVAALAAGQEGGTFGLLANWNHCQGCGAGRG